MAIDENIYKKGIKGELSNDEINSLPRDYAVYKMFFRHALENKNLN